jgi:hypothetical protein
MKKEGRRRSAASRPASSITATTEVQRMRRGFNTSKPMVAMVSMKDRMPSSSPRVDGVAGAVEEGDEAGGVWVRGQPDSRVALASRRSTESVAPDRNGVAALQRPAHSRS